MANIKLSFEDFQIEKLSKNQQKNIYGGGGDSKTTPTDPGKNGTGTNP